MQNKMLEGRISPRLSPSAVSTSFIRPVSLIVGPLNLLDLGDTIQTMFVLGKTCIFRFGLIPSR